MRRVCPTERPPRNSAFPCRARPGRCRARPGARCGSRVQASILPADPPAGEGPQREDLVPGLRRFRNVQGAGSGAPSPRRAPGGHHVVHVRRAGRRPRPARPRCGRPARRDVAVRHVDGAHAGVGGAPDVVEEPVADEHAARPGRRRRPRPSRRGTPRAPASSTGSRWCRRRRRCRSSTPSRREELLVPGPRPDRVGQHADLEPVDRAAGSNSGTHVGVGVGVRLPERRGRR